LLPAGEQVSLKASARDWGLLLFAPAADVVGAFYSLTFVTMSLTAALA